MISERILRKWRKDALLIISKIEGYESLGEYASERREQCRRILILTQELLDQHILRKESRK